jgi:hypothetical protein
MSRNRNLSLRYCGPILMLELWTEKLWRGGLHHFLAPGEMLRERVKQG